MIQPNKGFRRPEDFVNAANELSQPMAIGVSEAVLPALGITPPAPAPAPVAATEPQSAPSAPAVEAPAEPAPAQGDQPVAAAEAQAQAPAPAATPEKTRPAGG